MKPFLLTLFILIGISVIAQETKIVVQNSKEQSGTINIKWYSQQFTYSEGVNVYRLDLSTNTWKKLNNIPIIKLGYLDTTLYATDKELRMFVQLLKDVKPEQLNSFVLLNIMVKSFQSNHFARIAGIQYDDSEIETGKSYQYKIMQIVNGKEVQLTVSDTIKAGEFNPLAPPQEVFVRPNKKTVEMGWKCEDDRFYATNIYRSSGGVNKKLNNKPVLISMYQDSTGNQKYPEVKFTDKEIIIGINYDYKICGVDLFGNETNCSETFNIFLTDQEPPVPPDSLMFDIENMTVNLYWRINKSDDLSGFNIYRGNSSTKYAKINSELISAKTNFYSDNVPVANGYYYFISAVDYSGNEGKSYAVFADVKDIIPPALPENLRITADTGKIILKWDANNEPDLAGYLIYRSVIGKQDGVFSLITANPVPTNTYTDKLHKNIRNKFLYKIVAIDSSYNKSDYSEEASATMPDIIPPVKPFIKNVYSEGNEIVIEWVTNAEKDIAGYNIYKSYKTDSVIKTEKINSSLVLPGIGLFTDNWAKPGIKYYYHVIAIDSAGNRSRPSETYNFTLKSSEKENKTLDNFKVTYKSNKKYIELKWELVPGNKAIIYRSEGSLLLKPLTGILNENEYRDQLIEKGKTYTYQLRIFRPGNEILKSDLKTISIENNQN